MHPIRVRTVTGAEMTFGGREEFGRAIADGRVASDWEVLHVRGNRWLPVTAHPAWPSLAAVQTEMGPLRSRRNSDLVLIYPDFAPSADPVEPLKLSSDPFEDGPVLAPEIIHRVLRAPRPSDPHAATVMAAGRPPSGPQDRPFLAKAMPTFSRALHAAAELVQTKKAMG